MDIRITRPVFLLSLLASSFAAAQNSTPAYPKIDNTIGYKVDASWPSERVPGGEWGAMSSVAVGPDGNVWTFNRGKIPVQVFSQDGKLVKFWDQEGLFKNPHTIRFDRAGNLWIVDRDLHTVRHFSMDGKVLLTVGTPGRPRRRPDPHESAQRCGHSGQRRFICERRVRQQSRGGVRQKRQVRTRVGQAWDRAR